MPWHPGGHELSGAVCVTALLPSRLQQLQWPVWKCDTAGSGFYRADCPAAPFPSCLVHICSLSFSSNCGSLVWLCSQRAGRNPCEQAGVCMHAGHYGRGWGQGRGLGAGARMRLGYGIWGCLASQQCLAKAKNLKSESSSNIR